MTFQGERYLAGAIESVLAQERRPDRIAVVEPGITAAGGASEEAVERGERRVFLVSNGLGRAAQPASRQSDQCLEIATPQLLGRFGVTIFQRSEPDRDRILVHTSHDELSRNLDYRIIL